MNLKVKSVATGIVFLGLIAVALPYLASRWLPALALPPAARAAGVALALAGLALALRCIALFVRVGGGTQSPKDPPKRLVRVGPYAVVRNPMLTGVALVLAGEALALASPGVVAYAAAFVVVASVLMVAVEEPALARRFGSEYEAYRREVPRWLPRPPRRSR